MLKQREQAANLAVQKEQEEQAAQIFTPYWNSMINDDEEHSIQYKEYLENSSDAITPDLPTKEPEYSLSMGYKHLSTVPEMKSDEVIKSSAKNLVQIPSEYEVTSDNESGCDVPVKDESSPIFTTFSNPLFDYNDDFTFSNDESLSDEDVSMENFKFDFLEEFSGELMPTSIVNEERIKREHEEYISLMEKLLTINSFPGLLENFHANTIIETLPTSPIPAMRATYIHFLEELLCNDSIPLPKNESSNFDHHDDLSFPLPPLEPPDVEVFFDFEPNSKELILAVMNNIDELNEDECFDPAGGVRTPFLTLASPLRASGISLGWNFHVL
nr:hypothetical protein [Tanacetum cinerariifolium]